MDRGAIGRRILLVDDDETNLFLAMRAFKECKVEGSLTLAKTVEEAKGILILEEPPDLIVIDVHMPGADGFDLLGFIRGHVRLSLLRVVMLSSSQSPADVEKANLLGCNSYVYKPVDAQEYEDQLCHLFRYWLLGARCPSRSA